MNDRSFPSWTPPTRAKSSRSTSKPAPWEIDADEMAASRRLVARCPDAQTWVVRVGSPDRAALRDLHGPNNRVITGIVNANLQPLISVPVFSKSGARHEIEAMVDTGYNGWLTLPPAFITRLALPWSRRGRATLADGSTVVFDIYEGAVLWDGVLLTISD